MHHLTNMRANYLDLGLQCITDSAGAASKSARISNWTSNNKGAVTLKPWVDIGSAVQGILLIQGKHSQETTDLEKGVTVLSLLKDSKRCKP